MLSDREIREIEEGRRRGLSEPILQTWLGKLLTDRRDRLQQLAHVRQRLQQAYAYLDRLLRGPGDGTGTRPADARGSPRFQGERNK